MLKDLSKEEIEKIKLTAMGDDDINYYLPNTPIKLFRELKQYHNNINNMLPNNGSSIIILMEFSKMRGHWICITKNDNTINYFDSYGYKPEGIFDYFDDKTNKELDQDDEQYILKMLNNKHNNLKTFWNDVPYQKDDPKIATCGAHCIFFILNNNQGVSLKQYKQLMDKLKKKTGLGYDGIVSKYINKR